MEDAPATRRHLPHCHSSGLGRARADEKHRRPACPTFQTCPAGVRDGGRVVARATVVIEGPRGGGIKCHAVERAEQGKGRGRADAV
ncbi:hypothetical protein Naga_100634g1 [Nannochloropsis gaditana]|uniref:Uncharacterized protein n=1 Tax=Nannochloropsis gaditana TaxID=72520 RepID=W7UCV6_9STRA|nr:hypothetical protein Naga_100634g1 [Nannochloropsis gaditana]